MSTTRPEVGFSCLPRVRRTPSFSSIASSRQIDATNDEGSRWSSSKRSRCTASSEDPGVHLHGVLVVENALLFVSYISTVCVVENRRDLGVPLASEPFVDRSVPDRSPASPIVAAENLEVQGLQQGRRAPQRDEDTGRPHDASKVAGACLPFPGDVGRKALPVGSSYRFSGDRRESPARSQARTRLRGAHARPSRAYWRTARRTCSLSGMPSSSFSTVSTSESSGSR